MKINIQKTFTEYIRTEQELKTSKDNLPGLQRQMNDVKSNLRAMRGENQTKNISSLDAINTSIDDTESKIAELEDSQRLLKQQIIDIFNEYTEFGNSVIISHRGIDMVITLDTANGRISFSQFVRTFQ